MSFMPTQKKKLSLGLHSNFLDFKKFASIETA